MMRGKERKRERGEKGMKRRGKLGIKLQIKWTSGINGSIPKRRLKNKWRYQYFKKKRYLHK